VADRLQAGVVETAEWLGVEAPPTVWTSPLIEDHRPTSVNADDTDLRLDVDFDRIVTNATEAADAIATDTTAGRNHIIPAGESIDLCSLVLDDQTIWWLSEDDAIGTLIQERYRHRLVSDLRPGDLIVVPRGEGREELFSRLVEAMHTSGDVKDLDFMLARFRKACATLYRSSGNNWAAVGRQMKAAKASAWFQTQAWAEGETIAPDDPSDVKVVAKLAGDDQLLLGWRGVSAVAKEVRGLHVRLGRIVSKALSEAVEGEGPNLAKVRSALSDDVVEILDEFVIRRIVHIGALEPKPSNFHGIVTRAL